VVRVAVVCGGGGVAFIHISHARRLELRGLLQHHLWEAGANGHGHTALHALLGRESARGTDQSEGGCVCGIVRPKLEHANGRHIGRVGAGAKRHGRHHCVMTRLVDGCRISVKQRREAQGETRLKRAKNKTRRLPRARSGAVRTYRSTALNASPRMPESGKACSSTKYCVRLYGAGMRGSEKLKYSASLGVERSGQYDMFTPTLVCQLSRAVALTRVSHIRATIVDAPSVLVGNTSTNERKDDANEAV
jgi:hypothetical protein